jgi:energy-coupling factor transporter ATP-binding protein EcfA2
VAEVDLVEVTKRYGEVEACSGVNLRVPEGEFVTLLGPSGCGKSTTLNMIAGLEEVTAGDILMDGQRVNDLTPYERDVGDGLPTVRALSAHDCGREHRLHPEAAAAAESRDRGEGWSGGGAARAFTLPRSATARAFGWAAAARGAGAGDHP